MHKLSVKQARRAYMRGLYGTKDECYWRAKFEAADRAFDGGEFSGPIIQRRWEDKEDRLLAVLAHATGYTVERLADEFYLADMNQVYSEC